jgi:CTD small phosphatase-like protein 2
VNLLRDKGDANKKTLLIDIDETLVHCHQEGSQPYDIALPVESDGGEKVVAYVSIRPYAISFLKRMAKYFEIVAFTASE